MNGLEGYSGRHGAARWIVGVGHWVGCMFALLQIGQRKFSGQNGKANRVSRPCFVIFRDMIALQIERMAFLC